MIYPDEDMKRWECCDTQVVLANANYYYTKGQVDKKLDEIDGMTEEEVQTMINRSIRTKADKSDVNALSGQVEDNTEAIANTYTKQEVDNAITAATAPVNNTLTAHTANTSVHVTSQEKTYWNNKLDASAYTPTDLSNYYTKGQTDDLLDNKLDASAYTPTDLSNYYTKGETDGVVDEAVSGKADTSAVTAVDDALTAHTANTNVHVTATEKTYWNNKLDASAYTPTDLSNYYTKQETQGVVNGAVSGKADTSAVTQEISAAVSGLAPESAVTALDSILTAHTADTGIHVSQEEKDGWNAKLDASAYTPVDLSEYWTSAQTEVAISAATSGMPSSQTIEQMQGDITDLQNNKLDASAYTPTDLSNYYTSAQTEAAIEAATSGKVTTSDFNTYTAATATALSGKQDALEYYSEDTSGKTANIHIEDTENSTQGDMYVYADGTQMNGSRNDSDEGIDYNTNINVAPDTIDITYEKSTGDDTTDAHSYLYLNENNISLEVYSNEVTTTLEVNDNGVAVNNDAVATEPYVTSAISGKADTSAVTTVNDALTAHTANTSVHVTSAEKAAWDDKAEVIELTQAQYDVLVTKDPDVLYVITDAAPAEVIISTTITSSSTNGEAASAKAVYDFVGGLKMVKMTSVEYQALATKDANTVYFVGDSTNGYTMKLGEANIN